MVAFTDILEFTSRFEKTDDLQDLQDCFTKIITPLGFDKHTCLSYVDMNNPPGNAIMLFRFPKEWVRRYKREKYFEDDIVLKTIYREARPCLWRKIGRLDRRNRKIFSEAQEFGIKNGLTIPVILPGYYPTTINIAGEHRDVDPAVFPALHLLAIHYHNAVIRIGGDRFRPPAPWRRRSRRRPDSDRRS